MKFFLNNVEHRLAGLGSQSSYIFPPDARPGNLTTALSRDNIPVIDLDGVEGSDQTYIIQKILKASQEFGFFRLSWHIRKFVE
ncbi:hypothetical protein DVH24_021752 [Malus domestica]|uniref:Non-haem dioxygenase N-terminal domain-containing protein n=1 Tax=Malus domestica TaxID=3750 RepID=A0A498IT89_MALDO|nr:hypothetical protein DVH24_021752 [Malus domestica]